MVIELIDKNECSKIIRTKIHTKDQIVEEIRSFYDKNGRAPMCDDFKKKNGYTSRAAVEKCFGSWNNAIKEAGLDVNRMNNLTEEELLDFLKRFEKEYGRPPTSKDLLSGDFAKYPAMRQYINRFGSLEKAKKLVGQDMDSRAKKGISDHPKQKARLAEIFVFEHFVEDGAIDLAGDSCRSHVDGICPNKKLYDVKSSSLLTRFHGSDYFGFSLDKGNAVDFYYLLGFNKDRSELLYVWIVPWNFFDGTHLQITMRHIPNMKKYEITEKFKDVFNKWQKSLNK